MEKGTCFNEVRRVAIRSRSPCERNAARPGPTHPRCPVRGGDGSIGTATPGRIRHLEPRLRQHTGEVRSELLDVEEHEIPALRKRRVV